MVAFFEKLDITPGDKVALIGPNSPEWVITYLSVVYMGATIVPILHDFSPGEVYSIIDHSGARALIMDKKTYGAMESYPSGLEHIISLDDFSMLPSSAYSLRTPSSSPSSL